MIRKLYKEGIFFLIIMASVLAYKVAPNDPFHVDMTQRLSSPSALYPLGTDLLGRCILSRLLYGGQTTVGVVLIGALLVIGIGMVLGLLVSQNKERRGLVLESLLNAITAIPPIAYLIIFIGAWGNSIFTMVMAISLSLLLRVIKLVKTRAEIEFNKAYIYCAKTSGASHFRLLFWHVLPNILGEIIEFVCLSCADMVLAVVAFSFIGLGFGDNVVDWGMMVSESHHLILSHPLLTYYPVAAIFMCTLCFYLLGRGMTKGGQDVKHRRFKRHQSPRHTAHKECIHDHS